MPRRVYLLGVGSVLVALAFLLTNDLLWEPGVTEANSRRIRPGMTLTEARAILGERGISLGTQVGGGRFGPESWVWFGTEGIVMADCDFAGRVERAGWAPITRRRLVPLARLRAWLSW
jgi:hypothetical protein